ncbi:hypothetical protein [Pseudoclavibacter soli]|uniref:hypothetical protein n=1 Tax=Pseudoclavibacter soli TaxID=452623 RepID=UPI00040F3559|nr:hypothetical protein [Pseudoclavibacter soli]
MSEPLPGVSAEVAPGLGAPADELPVGSSLGWPTVAPVGQTPDQERADEAAAQA